MQDLGSLGKKAERAADRLVEIARDNNSDVRKEAITALGNIQSRSSQVIWALADIASGDSDLYLRKQAIQALKKLGPDSVNALTKLLRNSDFNIFLETAQALESMGGEINLYDISSYLESIADDPQRGPAARRLLKKTTGSSGPPPVRARPGETKKEETKSGEYKYIFITPGENQNQNQ
ncbi:MAG: HEAT repeat domain-containing protein [bacterium]|nr:HEAT repeat domain-containing protein [bacterium]